MIECKHLAYCPPIKAYMFVYLLVSKHKTKVLRWPYNQHCRKFSPKTNWQACQ